MLLATLLVTMMLNERPGSGARHRVAAQLVSDHATHDGSRELAVVRRRLLLGRSRRRGDIATRRILLAPAAAAGGDRRDGARQCYCGSRPQNPPHRLPSGLLLVYVSCVDAPGAGGVPGRGRPPRSERVEKVLRGFYLKRPSWLTRPNAPDRRRGSWRRRALARKRRRAKRGAVPRAARGVLRPFARTA